MIRCTCRSGTPVTEAASFAVMSVVWFAGTEISKIIPNLWKHISHPYALCQCGVGVGLQAWALTLRPRPVPEALAGDSDARSKVASLRAPLRWGGAGHFGPASGG